MIMPVLFMFLCGVFGSPSAVAAAKLENSFKSPDFAYPKDVDSNAEAEFCRASAASDWKTMTKAVIQMTIARDMVSNSNAAPQAEYIDSLAAIAPVPYGSLLYILEGRLYKEMYDSDSWKFRSRTLPLGSFPANPMDWSADLYALKVLDLVQKSQSDYEALAAIPLSDISGLLSHANAACSDKWSVADFVCMTGAGLLNGFVHDSGDIIPFGAPSNGNISVSDRCREYRDLLCRRRYDMALRSGNSPAIVQAALSLALNMPAGSRVAFVFETFKSLPDKKYAAPLLSFIFDNRYSGAYGRHQSGAVASRNDSLPGNKEFYAMLGDFKSRYPDAPYIARIDNALTSMSLASVGLSISRQWQTSSSLADTVSISNINKAYLLLIKLPSSILGRYPAKSELMSKGTLVKSIELRNSETIPFSVDVPFDFGPQKAGLYAIVPSKTPNMSGIFPTIGQDDNISLLIVSDISVAKVINQQKGNRIIVAESSNFAPIEGAVVSLYSQKWNERGNLIASGVTDSDGAYDIPEGNYAVRVTRGKDLYDSSFYSGKKEKVNSRRMYGMRILTDLSIYHPGDSVGFAAVAYSILNEEVGLESGRRLRFELRDANYQTVDSVSLVTDADGRVAGSFALPADGLLGSFSINGVFEGIDAQPGNAYAYFQVADYKSPTFQVLLDGASDEISIGDVLKIKGRVVTFAGLPLPDVNVNYNVDFNPAWWRWYVDATNATYGASLKTDANGEFIIELPTSALKNTPYEHGVFSVVATAVSPSGESQSSAPYRFAAGSTAQVGLDFLPAEICVEDNGEKNTDVTIPVYNALRTPVRGVDVEWRALDAEGREVASGAFRSPEFEFNFGSLPSGKYAFEFFPHELPENVSKKSVVIYRADDAIPPYETPLWIPQKKVTVADDARSVDISVGSSYSDSHILCSLAFSDGSSALRWLEIDKANKSVRIDMPESAAVAHITFVAMRDLYGMEETVVISREIVSRTMKVESVSFRDKVTPGDREEWKFRFSVDGKSASDVAAMAVMSNQALDMLAPFNWQFDPRSGIRRNFRQNIDLVYPYSYSWNYDLHKRQYAKVKSFIDPVWNFYGYSLYSSSHKRYFSGMIRGTQLYSECVVDESAPMASAKVAAGAAENLASVKTTSIELAEDGVEAEQEVSGNVDDAGEYGSDSSLPVRDVEMPLAFFRPMLKSDAEGVVDIDFTVPDFNTTWQLQLLGYDSRLFSAVASFNTVAAKRVIVQCNTPRFLRAGDVSVISATLYNNSESELPVSGEIELFDPLTGKIVAKKFFDAEVLSPSANRAVAMEIEVPSDCNLLGIRGYAYGDGHTDGEQAIIDILPSSDPVVESYPFYLAPDQKSFSMKLPSVSADASVTFQYCDNPIWYCVTALPDIVNPDSENLLSLLGSLFGNAAGLGLSERYPAIRRALVAESGDSLLESPLYKNASLKTVALNATPWVNNAASESLRMNRLSELTDSVQGERTVKSLIDRIARLQNPDGGWSWCQDMRSSEFMTMKALGDFAMLRHMDCMPRDVMVSAMIDKGIGFCRKEIVKDYKEWKGDYPYSSLLNYLYVESFFDIKNSNPVFSGIRKRALDAISDEWRSFSIYDKSVASILLYRSGRKEKALEIIRSLQQFASVSREKGVWFDNLTSGFTGWPRLVTTARALEAFSEVDPSSDMIDGLRQWLILSRQTEDWGTNRYTAEVIYAILSSGSVWTGEAAQAEIYLDGKRIDAGRRERLTGSVSIPLVAGDGSDLKIIRYADSPAWGGVISQYLAPAADIKADAVPDLSITKEVLLIKSTPDGNVAEKADSFKVGDKVRVTLTINCGRDMDYVAVTDMRAACLEPKEQLSSYTAVDGIFFYKEVRDASTNLFFDFLPKGNHVITYDCYVDRAGEYSLGIATVQCQYSPLMTAHSAGSVMVTD